MRQRTSPLASGELDTYRSRSAFKLVSLAQRYPALLGRGKIVVDLGAAPGGWSQVAVNRGSKVIAVDLNDIEPIAKVDFVRGNFLHEDVRTKVGELTGGKGVDTVLSDMMASMTGVRSRDVAASLDLVSAATAFGVQTLNHRPEEDGADGENPVKVRNVLTGGHMVWVGFALSQGRACS